MKHVVIYCIMSLQDECLGKKHICIAFISGQLFGSQLCTDRNCIMYVSLLLRRLERKAMRYLQNTHPTQLYDTLLYDLNNIMYSIRVA